MTAHFMRHIRSFDREPGPLWAGEADAAGFFDGGTKDQYEAAIAAVHPADGSLPEGQLYHVAGPSADGWTVVAVHDTQPRAGSASATARLLRRSTL